MNLFSYIEKGGSIMYLLLFLNIIGFAIMIAKFIILWKEKNKPEAIINSISNKLKEGVVKDTGALVELAKQEIASYVSGLERGVSTVKIIASISPLFGLLGTVIGVLMAFKVMATGGGMGDPTKFASGISLALITTVGGLIVAIPHYIGHNYLISFLDQIESKLEKGVLEKVL